ncbi:transcriptional regulator, ArsR family [Ruegeria intermedia]|uniref:Transcriptional regulator, ArsR family n=2 Tax=Ruegeria intermedia TaxID=996115 RepID=A0A1M4ZWN2_9RHOB|nr:transcriptional regulator, ArsR family [Ruegeria intermedia]
MIPERLSTLGHPQRLAVFRLLMRRYPDRVPASEIARALGLKPNTLSNYLSSLLQVGLISQQRAGTSLRYGVEMAAVRGTIDYLLLDCCRGRPEICAPASCAASGKADRDRKFNVLFICTGNSARSIFAEAILRDEAGDRFNVYSAGTRARSGLNPVALQVLKLNGHDISDLRAKTIAEFQAPGAPDFDFVFTVCDQAANEDCPAWPGQPISAHWGVPDPVGADGTQVQKIISFQTAYDAIRNRILTFSSLPFETLDRISLQKAVDDIGQIHTGETA